VLELGEGRLEKLVVRRRQEKRARDERLDFLGRPDNTLENLERVVREVCAADVEPDGMVFDAATVKTQRIKEDADCEGVRVRFIALLGRARVAMQLDVGQSGSATSSRPAR
jgi:hypothetical protein